MWGSAEWVLEAGRKPRAGAQAAEQEGVWRRLPKRDSEDALRSLLSAQPQQRSVGNLTCKSCSLKGHVRERNETPLCHGEDLGYMALGIHILLALFLCKAGAVGNVVAVTVAS